LLSKATPFRMIRSTTSRETCMGRSGAPGFQWKTEANSSGTLPASSTAPRNGFQNELQKFALQSLQTVQGGDDITDIQKRLQAAHGPFGPRQLARPKVNGVRQLEQQRGGRVHVGGIHFYRWRRRTKSWRPLAKREHKQRLSGPDLISILQRVGRDRQTIDIGAITAAQVPDLTFGTGDVNQAMMPREHPVLHRNGVGLFAADGQVAREREISALQRS